MEPLKNFSQAVIEQTIAGALSQLTGEHYTVDIRSKETLELSLGERNAIAMAKVVGDVETITERDKIVLILNKHTFFPDRDQVNSTARAQDKGVRAV